MTTAPITVLEWTYEPKGFFEESCNLPFSDGEIAIAAGVARGEFGAERYDEGQCFRDSAQEFLDSAFLAQQVQVHQHFTLSKAVAAREHADGRRDCTVFLKPVALTMSLGQIDVIVQDEHGNVTTDTKAERLQRQVGFHSKIMHLIPLHSEIKRMLQSFRNALNDPDNFLIHLFEIRETVVCYVQKPPVQHQQVNVSASDWSKFGRLANDEPLLEGRHRGKRSELRKATSEEVRWALCFGQCLIEGYVQLLDDNEKIK